MKDTEIVEGVIKDHRNAKNMFKDRYVFTKKQSDILFYLRNSLGKEQAQQSADQKMIEVLTKKVAKRQPLIDKLEHQYELTKSVKEEDI